MTGSETGADPAVLNGAGEPVPWFRHDNGRWVIDDAGRQPEVTAVPPAGRAGARPDTVVDGGSLGGLTYRATSQRGLGHQQAGVPRQDAYLVRPTPDRRWLVGCVADGVSEGKLSHHAADIVCQETTAHLARALTALDPDGGPPDLVTALPWPDIAGAANAAVRRAAETAVREGLERAGDETRLAELGTTWNDAGARRVMASTAVVFAVSTAAAPGGGHPAVVTVVAGDSGALLLDGGDWEPLSRVKNDGAEIAGTAVAALPGTVRFQPRAWRLRPGAALLVMTDGIGDPLGTGGGVVGRFLATMWQQPPDILSFAQHVGFYRKSFADDRTAVVVWAGS